MCKFLVNFKVVCRLLWNNDNKNIYPSRWKKIELLFRASVVNKSTFPLHRAYSSKSLPVRFLVFLSPGLMRQVSCVSGGVVAIPIWLPPRWEVFHHFALLGWDDLGHSLQTLSRLHCLRQPPSLCFWVLVPQSCDGFARRAFESGCVHFSVTEGNGFRIALRDGTSLVVQWLGLCAARAEGLG